MQRRSHLQVYAYTSAIFSRDAGVVQCLQAIITTAVALCSPLETHYDISMMA
jgi:hypothetical protein